MRPVLSGQVTASISTTEFDVNGQHVLCDTQTQFGYTDPADARRFTWTDKPYLGEPLQIYGHEDRKAHLIHANRVVFAPEDKSLHGQAVIDQILKPSSSSGLLVRADGFPILLTPSAQLHFMEPLKSVTDVTTNVWIEYQGHQRADGVLVAEKAAFYPNTVNAREERLDQKYKYDPSAVPPQDRQPAIERMFTGVDPKQVPPSHNIPLQNRLDTIGHRLIPAYQRELPDTDPTKVLFRFQLIQDKHATNQVDLPNGTILVPIQVLGRLQNDDQVAAYLGDGIAAVLEKQEIRDAVRKRLLTAATVASLAEFPMPLFAVPGSSHDQIVKAETEQRIRVSLALMHDAGYNLSEAPKTWWLLASKEQKPLADILIPDTAIYAYAVLGSTWRDTAWESTRLVTP